MQAGIAAGEHYDPDHKKSHKGPKGVGHKGNLPALESKSGDINQDGGHSHPSHARESRAHQAVAPLIET